MKVRKAAGPGLLSILLIENKKIYYALEHLKGSSDSEEPLLLIEYCGVLSFVKELNTKSAK